jgi:hypothetical protein
VESADDLLKDDFADEAGRAREEDCFASVELLDSNARLGLRCLLTHDFLVVFLSQKVNLNER